MPTFSVLLSARARCSFSLILWFLQRFIKEALNSRFDDGLRSPVGDRLALFRSMYNFSISSLVLSSPFENKNQHVLGVLQITKKEKPFQVFTAMIFFF